MDYQSAYILATKLYILDLQQRRLDPKKQPFLSLYYNILSCPVTKVERKGTKIVVRVEKMKKKNRVDMERRDTTTVDKVDRMKKPKRVDMERKDIKTVALVIEMVV